MSLNLLQLPEKAGSFQLFGKGFTDASLFLNEHQWPGAKPVTDEDPIPKHQRRGLRILQLGQRLCGRAEAGDTQDAPDELAEDADPDPRFFVWTQTLMDDLRLQCKGDDFYSRILNPNFL